MTIEENVSLASLTTFRIGGKARYFARVTSWQDIKEVTDFAEEKNIPYFTLGGGSNILISDQGFNGLVIKNEIKGIVKENVEDYELLTVGAGEDWDSFVAKTVEKGLFGLENLSLIPGTVGAAPVQNIGAYGSEIKDRIHIVEAYDPKEKGLKGFKAEQCGFEYRDSKFKHEFRHMIITSVVFKLKKTGTTNIEYKDLKNYFAEHTIEPTLDNVRKAVIEIRTKKLPDVTKIGTAGSFFKNPAIFKTEYEELLKKYPDMPSFPYKNSMVKVPAAWILDNVCGFKGVKKGHVGVHQNQALVLVNDGGATAKEVLDLANEMIASVKEKTGITLQPEVEYVQEA